MSQPGRDRRRYAVLLGFVVVALTLCLAFSRLAGFYIRPPGFLLFRALLYVQQGLLAGTVLAALGAFVPRILQVPCYAAFHLWLVWFCIWGLVRALFGFDVTPVYAWDLVAQPGAVGTVGLRQWEFHLLLFLCVSVIAGLAVATSVIFPRAERGFRRRAFFRMLGLFLLVHVPVRAYFTFHVNRSQYAAMALEDAMPFSLRSEFLLPGLRQPRVSLPNLERAGSAAAYIEAVKRLPPSRIPRKLDILWLVAESLRADAIGPATTPRIWAAREEFQIRLGSRHWSGGNTTKFGIFTIFTGIAGYHLQSFLQGGLAYPFLVLLEQNGYALRIGKRSSTPFAVMTPFLPPAAVLADPQGARWNEADAAMVDGYLQDLQRRDPVKPAFDFLFFDSTHWPYDFSERDAPFQPALSMEGAVYFVRDPEEVVQVRNRYKNACRFVDAQVGRILDALRDSGRLERTLVLVTGDHGEEFQEMDQLTHAGVMNDYQGRVPLWIRLPGPAVTEVAIDVPTVHTDIVPTVLDAMGLQTDVLYTQGVSLLRPVARRPMVILAEQGYYFPFYHALVTDTHISRWRQGSRSFLFSGIQRRDGAPVESDAWWQEIQAELPAASLGYHLLPDASLPPRAFSR